MRRDELIVLTVLYVCFFFFWLPVSLWRALRSQRGRKIWSLAAFGMWGGLLMAIVGKHWLGDGVREVGALLAQVGLIIAMLRMCWSIISRGYEYTRKTISLLRKKENVDA